MTVTGDIASVPAKVSLGSDSTNKPMKRFRDYVVNVETKGKKKQKMTKKPKRLDMLESSKDKNNVLSIIKLIRQNLFKIKQEISNKHYITLVFYNDKDAYLAYSLLLDEGYNKDTFILKGEELILKF